MDTNLFETILTFKKSEEGRTYNKSIGKSWADESSIGGFSLLSFGSGRTSNAELFVLSFNKIFSISSGCGQTEFYFPAFANTRSLAVIVDGRYVKLLLFAS